ncbi:MAG: FG-GAP-like repeat-containing protein, partial [Acidobacteriota bacterium]|nr:FG-GAP-like repeat-containing protein [Acidobacteriota bacterium]
CEQQGLVRVYSGATSFPASTPAWSRNGPTGLASYGVGVAGGDFNGDGFDDLVFSSGSDIDSHEILVYQGSSSGLSSVANWEWEVISPALIGFGPSISNAGDVNGDGFDDLIAGSSWFQNGEAGEGAAFVFHGSAAGLSLAPDWTREGNQVNVHLGEQVLGVGDVDADGFDDVLIRLFDSTLGLFHGSVMGLAATPSRLLDFAGLGFLQRIDAAGDVNNDGYADIIVGDQSFTDGQSGEGRALLYLGSASGLAATAAWSIESDTEQAKFGSTVGGVGDVNDDGYDDVLVGALHYPDTLSPGRVWLYLGSPAGLETVPYRTAELPSVDYRIDAAGDVNGDGFGDMLVSMPNDEVHLFQGPCPGLDGDADGLGNDCDNCPDDVNANQWDTDADGLGDVCDLCPVDPTNHDPDADLVCGAADNCPTDANPAQTDDDSDGAGLVCDCDDTDPLVYPGAPEILDGMDQQCPGDGGYGLIDEISGNAGFHDPADKDLYSWQPQQGATHYDVARAETVEFTTGCTAFVIAGQSSFLDVTAPSPGTTLFYLVRSGRPLRGSWGADSVGQERSVPCAAP